MTKDEALRLALEALELMYACYAHPDWVSHKQQEEKILAQCVATTMTLRQAIKAALEAKNEKPCPEFWDWLPKAYRHGDVGDEPRFTKYNMEVAFLAGKQSAALKAKDEPVAWISPTELLVMRGNALGGAKDWRVNVGLKPEDGDVGLYTSPPQRTWEGLTDEDIEQEFGFIDELLRDCVQRTEARLKERNI